MLARGAGRLGQPGDRLAHVRVAAEHAQAGAGDGARRRLARALDEVDVAGAEEHEVAVDQPAQQGRGLGGIVGRVAARHRLPLGGQLVEPLGDLEDPGAHAVGVLVHGAHVVEDGAQPRDEVRGGLVVHRPVEHDGHPGLGERVRSCGGGVGAVAELLDPPGDVAPDHDHGVHGVRQVHALPHDLGGHRVDEEGHVVGDQPDDRAAVGEAVHVDGGRAGKADLGELQVAESQPGELGRVVPEDLGRGLAPVVALEECRDVVGGAAAGQLPLGAEFGDDDARGVVEQFTLLAAGSLQRGELSRSAVHGAAVRLHRDLRGDTGGGGHVGPRYCPPRPPSRRRGGRFEEIVSGRAAGRRPSPRWPGSGRRGAP